MFSFLFYCFFFFFFFFNDTATTEIYTLSLHDALPIQEDPHGCYRDGSGRPVALLREPFFLLDRKSTRLNSSHMSISYAVFCLKKKNLHSDHAQQEQEEEGVDGTLIFRADIGIEQVDRDVGFFF